MADPAKTLPVDRFERWLRGRLDRFERTPRLEAGLLGAWPVAYVLRRLFPVVGNRLVLYALHLAEASLLARSLGGVLLVRSFLVAVACQLVVSAHWSVTELMRSALRQAPSKKRQQQIASAWLTLSALGAIAWYVVGALLVHWQSPEEPGAWVSELYALVSVGRAAADLLIRTHFGTAYAFGRIYRPSVTIWGPQVLAFALLLLCNKWFGAIGIPLAMLLAAPIGRGLVVYYSSRTLRLHRRPIGSLRWRALKRFVFPWRTMLLATVAGLVERVGAIAVVLAALASSRPAQVMLVYYLAPLLAGGSSLAQVFYPDLKRLESPASLHLFRRLVRTLVAVAVVVALFYGALGWATVKRLIAPEWETAPPMQFVPLLVGLTVASVVQNALLARGRFGALLAMSVGAMGAALWAVAPSAALAIFSVALLYGLVAMHRPGAPGSLLPRRWQKLPALEWWRVETGRLRSSQRLDLVERLTTSLPDSLVWLRGTQLHVAQPLGLRDPLPTIVVATGGLAGPVARQEISAPALVAALDNREAVRPSAAEQIAELRRRFPSAQVLRVGRSNRGLSLRQRQGVWLDAVARRRSPSRRAQQEFDVTSRVEEGAIVLLFCVPRSENPVARSRWRTYVRDGVG